MKFGKIFIIWITSIVIPSFVFLSNTQSANARNIIIPQEWSLSPVISPVLTEKSIIKKLFFGEWFNLSIENIIKNISEITDNKNTIDFRIKNENEYMTFNSENKEIKISENTPVGSQSLSLEVCSIGNLEENLDFEIPPIFISEISPGYETN